MPDVDAKQRARVLELAKLLEFDPRGGSDFEVAQTLRSLQSQLDNLRTPAKPAPRGPDLQVSVVDLVEGGRIEFSVVLHAKDPDWLKSVSDGFQVARSASRGRMEYKAARLMRVFDPTLPLPDPLAYDTDLP